ncbi:siderophore-interacting protein [Bifidobacterium amazonense]|uniref:Siderophore-interacting protein n=1 Tax=Bifidobacterium amazonense TaxID=2809027 RepID=A0ABS9VXX4_9BIFI|nr:siderophore-interacting protein [Bifidobacterium amazonense]MCH9276962.1 siderophore-interacting protein [Bifidobacterium amazonense]
METNERPSFYPFRALVAETRRIAPHFMRVTFAGPELCDVLDAGYDQRIKILLPLADDPQWERSPLLTDECRDKGLWWDVWRGLPLDRRPIMRTYTVRSVGLGGRVTVDFVLHDDAGPAGTFAACARPGDMVVLVAPDARATTYGGGIDFHPGNAGEVLLVGDETATPAIGGILRSLARSGWKGRATALIEVPDAGDRLDMPALASSSIEWIARGGSRRGMLLGERVRRYADRHRACFDAGAAGTAEAVVGEPDGTPAFTEPDIDRELLWETPDDARADGFYAWTAGEAAVVRDVRRILLRDYGLERSRAAFMGYWRDGKAEL